MNLLKWRISSKCANGSCCRIAFHGNAVHVSDSKDPDGPVVTYTVDQWQWLTATIRSGGTPSCIAATGTGDVSWYGGDHERPVALEFNRGEWDAFVVAVHAGEFDVQPAAA